MTNTTKRSTGLIAIVCYKAFSASLLAVTSVALLLAMKNHDSLQAFTDDYVLQGKREIIKLLLEKLSNLKPRTLEFSGIAAAIYSTVSAIEAIGLWYQQTWAAILVLGLVGISIPPEIYELIRGITLIKFSVLLANIAVFWYLWRHTFSSKETQQRD